MGLRNATVPKVTRRTALMALWAGLWNGAFAGAHEEFPLMIRGMRQNLRRRQGNATAPGHGRRVLLASGDGGFHPFGDAMAVKMASWGYDVLQFDSQHYLRSFTGDSTLTEQQVREDFATLLAELRGDGLPVVLMGWSAGAALAVLAGAYEPVRVHLSGVVAVALPVEGVLGWRWLDNLQFLPGFRAAGPYFDVTPSLRELSPTPLLLLQSDNDRWVSEQDYQHLASAAGDPKRTIFLEAGGHSFPDARPEFFHALGDGLGWIEGQ